MPRSDNIGSWTALRAERDPDRLALVCGEQRLTYAELDRRAAQVAGALAAEGVGPGDRVAVALKNRAEFVEALFGITRLGAVFVPLNFRLAAEEVAYALADSESRLVIAQAATLDAVRAALAGADLAPAGGAPRVIDADDGYASWRDAAAPLAPAVVDRANPASIVYTSGTTGSPKGAVITHENVLYNVLNYLANWDLRRDDCTVVVNPIFHVVLYIATVPLLYKGGKVVLMEDFDAAEALRLVAAEGATFMFAIPTAWQMMLDSSAFTGSELSRLRFIGSGGMACPEPLMDRFAQLGLAYRQGYGLTETTSSATTMDAAAQAAHRGSIGKPFVHVEHRIADDGELLLRGRNICAGYWNKSAETAAAFTPDGWFHTGDVASEDEDGYLYIVDRKKDLIISGGENIASIEVEQAVVSHPAVREAAVIGVPHERWGETPRAIVSLHPGAALGEDELIAHCRGRIARYKCPTSLVVLDDLPKTANGKIHKATLRRAHRDVPAVKG